MILKVVTIENDHTRKCSAALHSCDRNTIGSRDQPWIKDWHFESIGLWSKERK